jgi:hypothetical protein
MNRSPVVWQMIKIIHDSPTCSICWAAKLMKPAVFAGATLPFGANDAANSLSMCPRKRGWLGIDNPGSAHCSSPPVGAGMCEYETGWWFYPGCHWLVDDLSNLEVCFFAQETRTWAVANDDTLNTERHCFSFFSEKRTLLIVSPW